MRSLLPAGLVVLLACRDTASGRSPSIDALWTRSSESIPRFDDARQPGGCATLIAVEGPDILRVTANQEALYANEQIGLSIFDVSQPDEPKLVATSRYTGRTAGVFARERAALVVYSPWDRPGETVIRAVGLGRHAGQLIAEVSLSGAVRDVRGIGDGVIVTREISGLGIVLSSFVFAGSGLVQRDEVRLEGAGAITGGSPFGVAVARTTSSGTALSWIEVDASSLGLRIAGTEIVSGVVPRWRRSDHVIDVSEDAQVRLIGCSSDGCSPGSAASYARVDFAVPSSPRVVATSQIARAATGVFAFSPGAFVVARPPADDGDATELAVFRNELPSGTLRLEGTVSSLALAERSVVTIGWAGSATTGKLARIHHVDIQRAPRLLGSASFGGDWTWSPAYDDERALSFDPLSTLAALPMTTLYGSSAPTSAVQVLALNPTRAGMSHATDVTADRLLFVDGRLLAFSADEVTVVPLRHPISSDDTQLARGL